MIDWIHSHLLSFFIFAPIVAGGCLALHHFTSEKLKRSFSVILSGLVFLCSLLIWLSLDPAIPDLQFVEKHEWLPAFGVSYLIGVDGMSMSFILAISFLSFMLTLSSIIGEKRDSSRIVSIIFFVEMFLIGSMISLDLILFYIFFELSSIPLYFLYALSKKESSSRVAMGFSIRNAVGSTLMLAGILSLSTEHFKNYAVYSTSLLDLYRLSDASSDLQIGSFVAFGLAFFMRFPIWPFHRSLLTRHKELSFVGSALVLGVVVMVGGYGGLRIIIPLFSEAMTSSLPILVSLGLASVIYGGLVGIRIDNLKDFVLYASISHLGFVFMGLTIRSRQDLSVEALTGATWHLIHYGVAAVTLLLLIKIIYERKKTLLISSLREAAKNMPVWVFLLAVVSVAFSCVPGTGGFWSIFLVLVAVFEHSRLVGIATACGVFLLAVAMWQLASSALSFDSAQRGEGSTEDIKPEDWWCLAPLLGCLLVMSFYPKIFWDRSKASLSYLAMNHRNYRLEVQTVKNVRDKTIIKDDFERKLVDGRKVPSPSSQTSVVGGSL